MTHLKALLFSCLVYSYSFASGLAATHEAESSTKVINEASHIKDHWKPDRFFPIHKDDPKKKHASVKLGFSLKYVEFNLEDNNIAQSGINASTQGQSQDISTGSIVNFKKSISPSYEVLFAYKSSSDYDSPIFGINFWYFQQKPLNKTTVAKTNETFASTYHIGQHQFANDVVQINSNLDLKMRILKLFFTKYLFSAKHFFFNSGFGTNILVAEHSRNIIYTEGAIDQCLCFTQNLKGADIHLMTNIGLSASNAFGLEMYYETGLFFNKHDLTTHSFDHHSSSEHDHAHIAAKAHGINQMQRISVLLAYNNFQFSEYHYTFKVGFELLSLQADKISKSIGQSYSDTKNFYLPSFILNFDLYV
jgi:hypothetical protein